MALIEHLEKLKAFLNVSSYGSINAAAKVTGVSQAGLSKSISSLEAELGVSLFQRSRFGVIRTKEGDLLHAKAREILSVALSAETEIRSLSAIPSPDKMTLGMYDSIATYLFQDLASYLKTIYPKVSLELVIDTSLNLSSYIKEEKIDIAIGINFDRKIDSNIDFCRLYFDQYPFYSVPGVDVTSESTPIIFHPSATDLYDRSIEQHLVKLVRKRPVYKSTNFETIKILTRQGVGIGVMPTQVAKPLIMSRTLVPVDLGGPLLFGKHSIGTLSSKKISKSHPEFIKDIFRIVNQWSKI